ncbi:ATP-binding protein [Thiobacillus sp.]|uniref:AAA family ATPase n=1 Tax=Thiobacillus sp. TaxID=924 RepID=UPI0025E8CE84|nr:ATP-binding protein [Thiobacillus sp.]
MQPIPMPQIHFIEGPVGAGKSTYAKAIAEKGSFSHIALDEWFARLFSPDRPQENFVTWYIERKDRVLALILNHAHDILATNKDVALELGLIQRAPRQALFRQLLQDGIKFTVHILDAPLGVRRERVRLRNTEQGETFSMIVPDHIFEIASAMWEPPDDLELEEYEHIFPTQASGNS